MVIVLSCGRGRFQPMLIDVHQNPVGRRPGVIGPDLGLLELYLIEGLARLAAAAVGQGFRVGKDAADSGYPAGLPLNVGGSSEMAAGIIHAHPHQVAGLILEGGGVRGGGHSRSILSNSAKRASISSAVKRPFSRSRISRAAVQRS